jgi:imidazoleglycerol-phosphate dehydratase
MKIAFAIFDGMTSLDFIGVYDPLIRLKTMGFLPELEWEICAQHAPVRDGTGLILTPTQVSQPLSGYDLVVLPGGHSIRQLIQDEGLLAWLRTAAGVPLKASVSTGALLWGAAGFLENRPATTHPNARAELRRFTEQALEQRIVDAGDVVTAGGATAAINLGLYLCERIASAEAAEKIREQVDYPSVPADGGERPAAARTGLAGQVHSASPRLALISRTTRETRVEVSLGLDGNGSEAAEIQTGLGFLDHMLHHVALHGLFDLRLQARGDLEVDAHHTLEDVALALGQAFDQALGDRAGIVRIASAVVPMDEALASVTIDFSGRPYTRLQTMWHTPAIGPIPTRLFDHFLESFAAAARCNLHAQLLAGRDDHHQAEALFKALGRALSQAVQIDPRRQGAVPSTKGVLV